MCHKSSQRTAKVNHRPIGIKRGSLSLTQSHETLNHASEKVLITLRRDVQRKCSTPIANPNPAKSTDETSNLSRAKRSGP